MNSLAGLVRRAIPERAARELDLRELCSKDGRLHEPEHAFVLGTNRWNVVVCSRRSGKTAAAVRKALRLLVGTPGSRVCYVTLIRRNCRKYFHAPLLVLLRAAGAMATPSEQDLTITLANGSFCQAFGVQDMSDVESVLGDQWDLVLVDEAQSFRDDVIEELVDRAILPSLADRRGGLDFFLTPPPAGPVGYVYEKIWAPGRYERFHWTMFDNPWIPPDEPLNIIKARGLTVEHPIYKREFLGEFVVDTESLVYEYQAGRNDLPDGFRPDPDDPAWSRDWLCSMGVDLGFSDRDAICVLGWKRQDAEHKLHELWTFQKNHQDFDKLVEVFTAAVKRWKPCRIVGDTGGHGAVKVIRSLEARLHGIKIETKPASVPDSVALVNDDLRTGRLLLDPAGIVVSDAKQTVWEERHKTVSDAFHSDILDAMRYAHHCASHWASRKPAKEETHAEYLERNIRRRAEWERNPRRGPWIPDRRGVRWS